jgi:hypothetical protein
MKKEKRSKKKGSIKMTLLFLIMLIFIYSLATMGSYFILKDKFAFESDFISDIESRVKLNGDDGMQEPVRLYKDRRNVSNRGMFVMRKDTLLTIAEDVIRNGIKPYRAKLLDLYMDREGVLYIDFGSEIIKNFSGSADEEMNFIAGLFRAVKKKIPELSAMKILIEGREVESIGGHIDISKPIGGEIAQRI